MDRFIDDSPRHIDFAAGDYYLLMTGSIQQDIPARGAV